MDHVVLVLFENRSFDNLLGRLYEPGDVEAFEGVIGKDLSNPIPAWAEHGAEGGVVPYGISPSMDAPDPDPGEEYQHTNTQLFNVLDEANRFKDATEMVAPHNAPAAGTESTMEGFVTDYISFLTFELGRQPTYEEYSQIMTGYTPEQVPVISALARGFGVFDHWFSEVPSQTLANRSFWTAATSSGFVVNRPVTNFMRHNTAETIFNRLERCGKTWKVYVLEPDPVSFTGFIHMARLRERFATNFVPFAEFEADAAAGTLPDFSLIEPNLLAGHGDYHPAFGRALIAGLDVVIDGPSSVLAGEAFLGRIYDAVRSSASANGSNAFNTLLFIGFDEPGGTYDHVPPGPVPPPDPAGGSQAARVHLRPLRLSSASGDRLALGAAPLRVHRRLPPHLADGDAARDVESGRSVHCPRGGRPHFRCTSSAWRRPGRPRRGPTSAATGSALPDRAREQPAGPRHARMSPLPRALRARSPRRRPSRPAGL